jgi:subtilisin family serine protease
MFLSALVAASLWTKVVILDTGLDLNDSRFQSVLCSEGHRDFTGKGIQDDFGHGTHIAGLVKEYAGEANDYCLIIVKFYDKDAVDDTNAKNFNEAIKYASEVGDIVNVSGGGGLPSEAEETAVANSESLFVVAAGNNKHDLDADCNFFPACYPYGNILPVGNTDSSGHIAHSSNYGSRVKAWEVGQDVLSTLPRGRVGYLSGTSQSTGIHSGKLIYEVYRKRHEEYCSQRSNYRRSHRIQQYCSR